VLGSASHSGLGKEPAIVVGNSMGASRWFYSAQFGLSACMPCLMIEVQNNKSRWRGEYPDAFRGDGRG
jgi:hypothetical protein